MKLSFAAVIFDMDGVITKTALVHAAAWKRMFDDFLLTRVEAFGEPFVEFDQASDYLTFVDGKPRYEGVRSFLESRGIELPFGHKTDAPDSVTICGLGNRKNQVLNDLLQRDGVEVYPSTVELIHQLKEADIPVGVASSSRNCQQILTAVNLLDLFDVRVDGEVLSTLNLKGKPEPDIFIQACQSLKAERKMTVIVEDAVSGVQAGAAGGFGFVLGIAREENMEELKANGADLVVEDLGSLGGIEGLNKVFEQHTASFA